MQAPINKAYASKKLIRITLIFFVLILSLVPKKIYSQSPSCEYLVNCVLQCQTVVNIEFYDHCGSSPCYTDTYTFNAPGGWYFTCHGCETLCDVKVILVSVNSLSPSGTGFVDIGSQNDSGTTTTCGGHSTYDMKWFSNATEIGLE